MPFFKKAVRVTNYGDKTAVPATRLLRITLKAAHCPGHHPKAFRLCSASHPERLRLCRPRHFYRRLSRRHWFRCRLCLRRQSCHRQNHRDLRRRYLYS